MIRRSLILLLLAMNGFAASKNAGTSGAQFLKVAPSARAAGMAEAFTGVADDIQSMYWNPAGLAFMRAPELSAMHMQYFSDIQFEAASYAHPTEFVGTFGFSIVNLHTDSIERRTEDTAAAIGQFKASDTAYQISHAMKWSDSLSLGSSFKYIRQTLDSAKATAFAFDGGARYDTPWHDIRLGLAVQNVGTESKFNTEGDPLPRTVRLGASKPFLNQKLLIASDLLFPRDHDIGLALGGEYRHALSRDLALIARSGYRTDADADGLSGISAGGGFQFGRATVDFAWVPFGDLGNAYRFGLHLKFGDREELYRQMKPTAKASRTYAEKPTPLDTTLESLLAIQ